MALFAIEEGCVAPLVGVWQARNDMQRRSGVGEDGKDTATEQCCGGMGIELAEGVGFEPTTEVNPR